MRPAALHICLVVLALCTASPAQEARLPGFAPPEGGASLRGFGTFSEPLPTLIGEDRAYATMQFDKYDLNKDDALSREEVRKTPYKAIEERWFRFDADYNNRLSPAELANAYARTRVDKTRKLRQAAVVSQS